MRNLCILGLFLFAASNAILCAEDLDEDLEQAEQRGNTVSFPGGPPLQGIFPRFRDRTLVLDINARVIEQNQTVVWDESHRTATMPGRPVGIRLVGTNLVVAVQFTPYIRRGVQNFLVAQGQIWMDIPGQGIRYHTSIQTIPLEFGEPIYFFPLGSQSGEDAASIEVMLTLHPYVEEN